MMPTATDVRNELKRVLSALAQPADEQISYLRSLEVIPSGPSVNGVWASVDELALELDAIAPAAYGREADGDFTSAELEAVRMVDRALSAMSGQHNADLWTEQALRAAPKWANVRELAKCALAALERSELAAASPGTRSSGPTRS